MSGERRETKGRKLEQIQADWKRGSRGATA